MDARGFAEHCYDAAHGDPELALGLALHLIALGWVRPTKTANGWRLRLGQHGPVDIARVS